LAQGAVVWQGCVGKEIYMKRAGIVFVLFAALAAEPLEAKREDTPVYDQARESMVDRQIRLRGIRDRHVLSAMSEVPRHLFVPRSLAQRAYEDRPLPIGEGQTISQPYIVALMTQSLGLDAQSHVLEIGTGSGYQAAVLSRIAAQVTSIEIKGPLYRQATKLLRRLGLTNVETIHGDGYFGHPDAGPYDGIMITAAVDHIPPPVLKQLKNGAKLVLPLGNPFGYQNLVLVTRQDGGGYTTKTITGVLFVPLTGHALREDR